jgi:hypothetical protein
LPQWPWPINLYPSQDSQGHGQHTKYLRYKSMKRENESICRNKCYISLDLPESESESEEYQLLLSPLSST